MTSTQQSQQSNSQNAASPQLTLGQLGGGALASGDIVNLFRGNLSFPLEVLSLPGRNGLNCKVNLLYQSNVQYTIDKWNLDHPTDIVGMGWSLPFERIIIDAKDNGSTLDDQYYLFTQGQNQQLIPIPTTWTIGQINEATFTALQNGHLEDPQQAWLQLNRPLSDSVRIDPQEDGTYLLYDDGNERVYQLQANDENTYQVSTAGQSFELQYFQYWQISYYPDYEKWEIVKDDGSIYTYGSSSLAQEAHTLQYGIRWNNWVGSTTQDGGTQYVTSWNLAQVTNIYGNYYALTYTTTTQTVGDGSLFYTKECHVDKIVNDLDWSLQYTYGDKTYDTSALEAPKEYLDPHQDPTQIPTTPDAFQSQYNTKYLEQVALINAQATTITYVQFTYYDLQNLSTPSTSSSAMAQLAYGATYKRYLKSITQYYQEGETKPNLQFTYNFTTDATQNRGALTQILYPTGGIGTINYTAIEVGADQEQDPGARNRTITNPFGDTEKDQSRNWYGPDYVVNAWYSKEESALKLNVFTWMGHWYESNEAWFSFDKAPITIDSLQIATSLHTFVLAIQYSTNNQQEVYLFNRRPLCQGNWDIQEEEGTYKSYTYGTATLQLDNGNDFFLVNGTDTSDDKVIDRYAWNWASQAWQVDNLTSEEDLYPTSASSYYSEFRTTAYSNYYIILCHDQSQDPPLSKLSLYYLNPSLNDDGTLDWQLGSTMQSDQLNIPSNNGFSFCNFAPSDSFAGLAYITGFTKSGSTITRFNYALQVLTWDTDFSNLAFADVDNVLEENFQNIPAPILYALGPQAVDNTLIGAGPNTYYYDGNTWQYQGVGIHYDSVFTDPSTQYYWYAYAADTILKTENTTSGIYTELTYRNLNEPEAGWSTIVLQDEEAVQDTLRQYQAYPSLTSTYLSYGTKLYNRGVYNTWAAADDPNQLNEDFLLVDFSTLDAFDGLTINTTTFINEASYFLAFMTVDANGTPTSTYFAYLRNGDLLRDTSGTPQLEVLAGEQVTTLLNKQYRYQKSLQGELPAIPMGLITYAVDASSPYSSLYTDAVTMHRYANESLQNPITAFVVNSVQVNTGYDTHNKCYAYTDATAAQDATGEIARFQTVTEYDGCATPAEQQDGYTVSHFYNGLPLDAAATTTATISSEEAATCYTMLDGMLIAKEQYDTTGQLVSSSTSSWGVVTEIATDAQGTELRQLYGGIAQVYASTNMLDGVTTTTEMSYSLASGQPTQTTSSYHGSTGEQITDQTLTTYAYEKYEGMWEQNLLHPTAQTLHQGKTESESSYALESIQVQTYQQWAFDTVTYWSGYEQYIATAADAAEFTWWSTGTPSEDWLKVSTVSMRNAQGELVEGANATGIKQYTIYDDQERFTIATFGNASASDNGVSYDSFEDYQATAWTFSASTGGALLSTDSLTGTNCYNITASGTLSKTTTLSVLEQDYVFGGWFKTTSGVTDTVVTLGLTDTSSSTQASKTLSLTVGEWQYFQWVVNPSAAGLSGSSLTLSIDTTLSTSGAYVRLDHLFWMPLESTFTADVYDQDLLLHTASLAPNGVVKQIFYNLFYHPVGQTSVYGNPVGFEAAFMTRQTTAMDDFNQAFPTSTPNCSISIGAQEQGFYDAFKEDALDQYTFINTTASDWQVGRGQLQLTTTSAATLGAQLQRTGFAADSLAAYVTLDTDSSNTVSLGTGLIYVLWNGTAWQLLQDNGGTLTTLQTVSNIGFQKEWLLAVFDSRVMFFANGICVFNYQATGLTGNCIVLGMQQPGTFNPLLVAEDISLSLAYRDGTNKTLQSVGMESGSSVLLGATLYDHMARGAISVKPSRITTSDVTDPFSFYEAYVTNGSSTGTVWSGAAITGAVNDYHPDDGGYPFSRHVLEAAPTQRVIQIGQPGADFAITEAGNTHITTISYGTNQSDPGFYYALPTGQYFVTSSTDPDGNVTTHYMDAYHKTEQEKAKQKGKNAPAAYIGVIQTAPAASAAIKYSSIYDKKGQLIASLPPSYYEAVTTPDTSQLPAQASTFTYDFLGRQIAAYSPDTGTTQSIYNQINQLCFSQDANGAAQGYLNYMHYDNLGRVTEKGYYVANWDEATLQDYANNDAAWPNAPTTWSNRYLYDGDDTTAYMVGNLWKSYANNDESETGDVADSFAYDGLSNVTQHARAVSSYSDALYTVSYTYNSAGMKLTTTDSVTGLVMSLAYNPLGQVVSVDSTTQERGTTRLAHYTYTQEGKVQKSSLFPSAAGATTRHYTYMPPGWTQAIADESMTETLQYTEGTCDNSGYYTGAVASQSVAYTNGQALTDDYCFKVDYLNRVATANNSTTANSWGMDANSNFNTHVINEVTRTYSYTADTNQLASIAASDNSFARSYTYTEDGAMATVSDTSSMLMQFAYSKGIGMPQTISLPTNATQDTVAFTYGPDNRRVLKQTSLAGETVSQRLYIHGLASRPVVEIDNSGGTEQAKRYINVPGGTFIFYDNQYYLALKDHLGSTRSLVDEAGTVVGQYNYDVYGSPTIITAPAFAYDYLYTGQEYDTETGLYSYKARLYDPTIGRFTMIDPAGQFFSPYVYAGNNPVIFIDPSGQMSGSAIGAIVGGVVAVAAALVLTVATAGTTSPILVGTIVGASLGGGAASISYGAEHQDKNGKEFWKGWGAQVSIATVGGAIGGAGFARTMQTGLTALQVAGMVGALEGGIGFGTGWASTMASESMDRGKFIGWSKDIGINSLVGLGTGFATGFVGGYWLRRSAIRTSELETELETTRTRKDAQIHELEVRNVKQGNRIRQLEARNARRDNWIRQQGNRIRQQGNRIRQLEVEKEALIAQRNIRTAEPAAEVRPEEHAPLLENGQGF